MWILAPYRLIVRTGRRFNEERCSQTAAALSFATLLGVVPMVVVAFALISFFPIGIGFGAALEKFVLANFLPEKAGAIIAKYVGQFASRAGRVTLLGILSIALTALMQMLTIERAFNHIWRVKLSRSLIRRVLMHGTALLLGPLVFGASLVVISFVISASLGMVNEPRWVNVALLHGVMPFLLMSTLFGFLYWGVPNKAISAWHAGLGGVLAALGFLLIQKLFTFYISSFNVNTVVYGAFSVVPVFLLWIYASWSVILLGALVVAELPKSAKP